MAENAAAIFPAADMRQELRIPDGDGPEGAALSASMARHIEAAISHIERRTSLALVDRARDIRVNIWTADDPAFIPLSDLISIESVSYSTTGVARRAAMDSALDVGNLGLRKVAGGYEVTNTEPWPKARDSVFLFTVTQGIPLDQIPSVFKDVIVMLVRDAIDGVPRAATERAVADLIKPWVW